MYTVSLIEIELESFDINPERRIQWPKQINGHIVPRMDGALLLYDVMNRESIQELRYYREAVFVPAPGPDTDTARAIAATLPGSVP